MPLSGCFSLPDSLFLNDGRLLRPGQSGLALVLRAYPKKGTS